MGVNELYTKYRSRLLKICMHYSVFYAEDILHESFIKIINGLDKFKGNSSVYTWMVSITKNTALNYIRKDKRKEDLDKVFISQDINYDFLSEDVNKVLTPGCLKVFNLVQEGYSHVEISEKLSIKDVSSRTQYFKARKILMNHI